MTLKFELGRNFCTMHLPSLEFYRLTFRPTRSEVIVLTNKQTPLKTSNALPYATTLDKIVRKMWFFAAILSPSGREHQTSQGSVLYLS